MVVHEVISGVPGQLPQFTVHRHVEGHDRYPPADGVEDRKAKTFIKAGVDNHAARSYRSAITDRLSEPLDSQRTLGAGGSSPPMRHEFRDTLSSSHRPVDALVIKAIAHDQDVARLSVTAESSCVP